MSKEKYDNSSGSMYYIIIGFNIFLFGIMGFAWMDGLFFNDALLNGLRASNQKVMLGMIMIPIFGGGALVMYFATKSNNDFMEGYAEKMATQFDNAENAPELLTYNDESQISAQNFAAEDKNFNALYKRFKSYLAGVSGEGIPSMRMAVDINSGGRMDMISSIFFMGFIVVPLILVAVIMIYYVKENYEAGIGEAVAAMRHISPVQFFIALIMFVGGFIYAFSTVVLNGVFKMLDFVKEATGAVLNTAPPESFDGMYQKFLNERMLKIDSLWPVLIWMAFIFLAFFPFIVGVALLDFKLLILCGTAGAIAFYFKRKGSNGDAYRISDKGWVRFVAGSGAVTDFSIDSCDEVIVRYQSILVKSTRISSDSAMVRSVLSPQLTDALNVPELIPSVIIFYRKDEDPVLLPLRYMNDENKDGIESHQIEFFFALWLKERGFAFELQETDEDAGDWRAFRTA